MSDRTSEYLWDRMSVGGTTRRKNLCNLCLGHFKLPVRITYMGLSEKLVPKKSGGSSFSRFNFKHWEYPHPFPDTQISGHGSTLRYPETGWWCGAALLRRHTPPCNVGSMSRYRLVTFAMSGTGRRHGHGNQRHSQPDILSRTDEGSSARSFRETNKDIINWFEVLRNSLEVVTLTALAEFKPLYILLFLEGTNWLAEP